MLSTMRAFYDNICILHLLYSAQHHAIMAFRLNPGSNFLGNFTGFLKFEFKEVVCF